jgi:hypothetical protein
MFCTACGTKNQDRARFCSSCGTQQPAKETNTDAKIPQPSWPNQGDSTEVNGTSSDNKKKLSGSAIFALIVAPVAVVGLFFFGFNLDSIISGEGSSTPSPTATNVTNETNISSYDCEAILKTISKIERLIADESDDPNLLMRWFEGAASDWALVAGRTGGERAEWLNQMSENSYFVATYIEYGAPLDGPERLDRLVASFDRASRYCD